MSSDLPGVNPATLNRMLLYYRLMTKWSGLSDSTELSQVGLSQSLFVRPPPPLLSPTPDTPSSHTPDALPSPSLLPTCHPIASAASGSPPLSPYMAAFCSLSGSTRRPRSGSHGGASRGAPPWRLAQGHALALAPHTVELRWPIDDAPGGRGAPAAPDPRSCRDR
jgi:hypothetical protein